MWIKRSEYENMRQEFTRMKNQLHHYKRKLQFKTTDNKIQQKIIQAQEQALFEKELEIQELSAPLTLKRLGKTIKVSIEDNKEEEKILQ